jgi:2-oxoglutarate dehydrogenase E1 component
MSLDITTLQTLEKMYRRYQKGESIDPSWESFFSGFEFGLTEPAQGSVGEEIVEAFRKYGHLKSHINPLEEKSPPWPKELVDIMQTSDESVEFKGETMSKKELIDLLTSSYTQPIGAEFMHIEDQKLKEYLTDMFEPLHLELSNETKKELFKDLVKAEVFETFIHTKYVGQTRFSLEGMESLIPMMKKMVDLASMEAKECVIGMAHRGRLNVLAHILGKSYAVLFHEFESHLLSDLEGTSDVKYHKGYSSDLSINGKNVHLHISANPSHLESIDPVTLGEVRAKLTRFKDEKKILPILIHGDASFAGQGIVYETMQMMHLPGYDVGGAVHIITNNQIGFTTLPEDGRSTRYASDLAKSFQIPILHVNAEYPELALFAATVAVKIRQNFGIDVIIDLSGYRKYGHNEGDEPSFTQPLQYQTIKKKKSIRMLYQEKLIQEKIINEEEAKQIEKEFKEELEKSHQKSASFQENPPEKEQVYGSIWSEFIDADEKELFMPIDTAVPMDLLQKIGKDLCLVPADFTLHPKIEKAVKQKEKQILDPNGQIGWSLGEELAMATLLHDGISVRFSGEDSRRGTFNQRHAAWIDQKTAASYLPLAQFAKDETFFEIINSPLSEFGALGFEHGFSLCMPKGLIVWEAQYGDFVNGAQVIIDEYIASSEQKWMRRSALVVLLPHGQEGQGPDHSSGRIERFLELCAQNNMQVCYPTTPKQYFHLLRRQGKRKLKKPLIVFTPKSLLRHPKNVSQTSELVEGAFEEFLDTDTIKSPKRLIFCSGKIYYDLTEKREKVADEQSAIIRIEQFYPIKEDLLKKILAKYSTVKDFVYVQEEPKNMGGWPFIMQQSDLFPPMRYIGRPPMASPASGVYSVFAKEQQEILSEVFPT